MNYFIHDERDLSPAYVRSCKKFFKELKEPDSWLRRKPQASSLTMSLGCCRIKNKGGLMEDYTRYQLDELYNILSQVQQAIELLEEEKKKNK